MKANDEFKLCYVDGCWAFFTTCPLDEQWGDDWNDTPYEHNAGSPYEWAPYMKEKYDKEPYEIKRVAYYAPLITPDTYYGNSPYSVDLINTGAVPWLRTEDPKSMVLIMAGTSLPDFIRKVHQADGKVYVEVIDESE